MSDFESSKVNINGEEILGVICKFKDDNCFFEKLEARVAELTKEKNEYNARRKEAMVKIEEWRTKAQKYLEALNKIKETFENGLTPVDTLDAVQLITYKTLDKLEE